MKITLFWPLYPLYNGKVQPNLTIATLSKVLEENFEVSCVDANLFFYKKWGYKRVNPQEKDKIIKKFVTLVEKTNPDILAIGSWTHLIPFVAEFVREFKARNPDVFTILGGYNPTILPNETLQLLPFVDCLVRGEGEYTLFELAQHISKGENWHRVKGISFTENGNIVHTEDRELVNLDKLPLIDFENFIEFQIPGSVYLMTSRSCPYTCSFCSVHAVLKYYRVYSPEYIMKQLEHLFELYGVRFFSFEDDDFLASKNRSEKVAKILIEKNYDFSLAVAGRSDEIYRENVKLLKKAGFEEINIGIESIVPETLKFLNKTDNPAEYLRKTEDGIKIFCKEGMRFGAFFIIGTPNETKEDMMKTVNFIEKVSSEASRIEASYLKLYPGSPLWEKYLKKEISVFKAFEPHFPFDEKYTHLIWATPDVYMIRNQHYSDDEFKSIVNDMLNRVNQLK